MATAYVIPLPMAGVQSWTRDAIVASIGSSETFRLQNTTAATAGVPVQYSPGLAFQSDAWNTTSTVTQTSKWMINSQPASNTSITSQIMFSSSEAGSGYAQRVRFDSSGAIIAQGIIFAGGANGTGTMRCAVLTPGAASTAMSLATANTSSLAIGQSGITTTLQGNCKHNQAFGVAYRSAASTVTVANTDGFVGVSGSGARTVNLPAANTCVVGFTIVVQEIGGSTGVVTINRAGSDTINGAASVALGATAYARQILICDGSAAWYADTVTI